MFSQTLKVDREALDKAREILQWRRAMPNDPSLRDQINFDDMAENIDQYIFGLFKQRLQLEDQYEVFPNFAWITDDGAVMIAFICEDDRLREFVKNDVINVMLVSE